MTAPRLVHSIAGGDIDAARRFGLTLIAECGLVFVPKYTTYQVRSMNLPECEECNNGKPHRLAIDPHIVYRYFDANDRLIYVGCTRSPKQRMDQHRMGSWWHSQSVRVRLLVFPNKEYARWKETQAIATENPRWNVRDRDRGLWTADDYADFLYALRQNGAALKRQEKVIAEAERRFQVDLNEIEVAA